MRTAAGVQWWILKTRRPEVRSMLKNQERRLALPVVARMPQKSKMVKY